MLPWGLQKSCRVRDAQRLVVERCRDTLRLGPAGTLGGWALQVGHYRDIWWWGTAGMPGGRARQDALRLGHAVRPQAQGEDNIDFQIQQTHREGGEQ